MLPVVQFQFYSLNIVVVVSGVVAVAVVIGNLCSICITIAAQFANLSLPVGQSAQRGCPTWAQLIFLSRFLSHPPLSPIKHKRISWKIVWRDLMHFVFAAGGQK